MIIKELDFLSPPITFYHKGSLSHSSILSGIISSFSIAIIFSLAIYYSLEIIQRKNPTTLYFNTFVKEAGTYPINASCFFHYLNMYKESSEVYDKGINFTYFRIIGLDTYFHYYLKDKNLSKFDHWLYGYCNNDSDTEGIGYLIKDKDFYNSACIKKYFSSSEQKYYDTSHPKFKWPIIAHGTYNPYKKFYNVFVERCKEDTIKDILGEGFHCSNDDEMDEMLSLRGALHFYFIDSFVDMLNYKQPNTKYFNRVENGIDKDNYSINNLNINPATIITNNGLFFENIKKENGYIYDRNDVFTYATENHQIYMAYYLWLGNRMFFYQRIYKRIQDIVSQIGGITQAVIFTALYINQFYNHFIIISDTKKLLSNFDKENHKSKRIKLPHLVNNSSKANIKKINNATIKNSEKVLFNDDKFKFKKNEIKEKKDLSFSHNYPNDKNDKSKSEIFQKDTNSKKNNDNSSERINNFNFFSFLLYKISCRKKNKEFKIYEDFRSKMISEEHLVKIYLNIYNLMKLKEKKKSHYKKIFHIKDLMRIVSFKCNY